MGLSEVVQGDPPVSLLHWFQQLTAGKMQLHHKQMAHGGYFQHSVRLLVSFLLTSTSAMFLRPFSELPPAPSPSPAEESQGEDVSV